MLALLLIVGTWLLWASVLVALGSGLAFSRVFAASPWLRLRASLWLGLGVLVILALGCHLIVPLSDPLPPRIIAGLGLMSTIAAVLSWAPFRLRRASRSTDAADSAGVLAVIASLGGVRSRHLPRRPSPAAGRRSAAPGWVVIPALGASVLLLSLALTSLGPITNYDTGLYHWPAISYAEAYRAIPGLGNLDLRLGYATSVFPLAAILPTLVDALPVIGGATPISDGQTLRLLNGFLIALVIIDVIGRYAGQRARPTAGTHAAILGLAAIWAGIGHSWDFITSPSPDTGPLIVTVVLVAYLLDATVGNRLPERSLAVAVALVLAGIAFTMRVQLLPVLAGTLVIAALMLLPRVGGMPRRRRPWPGLILGGTMVTALVVVMWLRDQRLTGWFLYPLTVFPLNAEWRVPEGSVRAYAEVLALFNRSRTPASLPTMQWLPGWLGRHAEDFAFMALIALIALAVLAFAARGRDPAVTSPPPRSIAGLRRDSLPVLVAVLMTPFAVTVVATLLLAPDPRFIWGCLCAIGLIPAAVALSRLPGGSRHLWRTGVPLLVSTAVLLVLVPSSLLTDVARWGQLRVTFATYPLTVALGPFASTALVPDQTPTFRPEVTQVATPAGLVVLQLNEGDQCWRVFPLCVAGTAARPRGDDLSDGLLP